MLKCDKLLHSGIYTISKSWDFIGIQWLPTVQLYFRNDTLMRKITRIFDSLLHEERDDLVYEPPHSLISLIQQYNLSDLIIVLSLQ